MSDLISRSALMCEIDWLNRSHPEDCGNEVAEKLVKLIEQAPAVDVVSPGVYEQIKWERDVAIKQLEELGIGFGQKKPDMEPVRHERWIEYDRITWCTGDGHKIDTTIEEECSNCGRCVERYETVAQENYCPSCGAKMDAEVSE